MSPTDPRLQNGADGAEEHTRRRKSRWGRPDDKVNLGLPTTISVDGMDEDQLKQYLRIVRVEEISRRLRSGDVLPDRSPSPAPEYGNDAARLHTREQRYRKKYEDERHRLVDEAMQFDPTFRPPVDYKRSQKLNDKVYIPAKEFPEINFMGLIIGPRGNTLKKIEAETGAKISIRGRGTAKEGKVKDGKMSMGDDDEMHAYVAGDAEYKITQAVKRIEQIIEQACSLPEQQNELKQRQLRELAILNGTLRDDENQPCQNCGALGHRRYECPERLNFTNNLVCRVCGGTGHVARDCRERANPEALREAQQKNERMNYEYRYLMAELGQNNVAEPATPSGGTLPPWASNAAPWQRPAGGHQAPPPMPSHQHPGGSWQPPLPDAHPPPPGPPVDAYGGYPPPPPPGDQYGGYPPQPPQHGGMPWQQPAQWPPAYPPPPPQ